MTLPPLERYLNWVHDITPPPSRDHGKENLPPQDAPHKLPRKLRPRRRREKQSGPTANHNSPSREAGNQPGTSGSAGSAMRAPVKHPLTFLRPQHPRLTANHNLGCLFDPDHPESGRLFKLARSSIQQDYTTRSRRDNFSGSGLSSPALQRSHRDSFSRLPSGQPNKNVSLTDPHREARIAGGLRPGPVQPNPRAACPDTRLNIDAAPPEAAAVSRAERPPTVLDIPESGRLDYSLPRTTSKAWITVAQAPPAQTAQESLFSVIPAQEAPTTLQTLV